MTRRRSQREPERISWLFIVVKLPTRRREGHTNLHMSIKFPDPQHPDTTYSLPLHRHAAKPRSTCVCQSGSTHCCSPILQRGLRTLPSLNLIERWNRAVQIMADNEPMLGRNNCRPSNYLSFLKLEVSIVNTHPPSDNDQDLAESMIMVYSLPASPESLAMPRPPTSPTQLWTALSLAEGKWMLHRFVAISSFV
jgi:hypothetical protein